MAVVAAAAGGLGRLVVPCHAAPALRERLAALPVAKKAPFRVDDGFYLIGFQRLGQVGRRLVMSVGAHALHAILHHALHGRLSARMEIALHDPLHLLRRGISERCARHRRQDERETSHRLLPGPWYASPRAVAVRKWISATVVSEPNAGSGVRICR